jgi:hypothetical protein
LNDKKAAEFGDLFYWVRGILDRNRRASYIAAMMSLLTALKLRRRRIPTARAYFRV